MKNGRSGRYAAAVLVVSALVAACMSPPLRAFESLPDALYLKSGAQTSLEFTLPGSALITSDSAAVISSLDQSVGSMGNTVTLTAANPFRNLCILIHEGRWAMISKSNAPAIHFVIHHPKLRAAIESFTPPMVEE